MLDRSVPGAVFGALLVLFVSRPTGTCICYIYRERRGGGGERERQTETDRHRDRQTETDRNSAENNARKYSFAFCNAVD